MIKKVLFILATILLVSGCSSFSLESGKETFNNVSDTVINTVKDAADSVIDSIKNPEFIAVPVYAEWCLESYEAIESEAVSRHCDG